MLKLRPADMNDAERLLRWRNDEQTRANSHIAAVVSLAEHLAWLEATLCGPNQLFIVEDDGVPVGSVRADREPNGWKLSWTVAPEHRGKSHGKHMVRELVQQLDGPCRAEIRYGNVASEKVAAFAGLTRDREQDGFGHWSYRPRRTVKTVACIQARMGSSRLPGKVMEDIAGATVLARCIRRTLLARTVDQVVVATTELAIDEAIVAEAERLGVACVRGSEDDVLSRYHKAMLASGAEVVVRITSDCPLIDPAIIDAAVSAFKAACPLVDYASTVLEPSYPRGLDVEVFTAEALHHAMREATQAHEREHVTPYFYEHPDKFRLLGVKNPVDYSGHRWCVDTIEDLRLVRAICERLGAADQAGWQQVLPLFEVEPELAAINGGVQQKPLHPAQ